MASLGLNELLLSAGESQDPLDWPLAWNVNEHHFIIRKGLKGDTAAKLPRRPINCRDWKTPYPDLVTLPFAISYKMTLILYFIGPQAGWQGKGAAKSQLRSSCLMPSWGSPPDVVNPGSYSEKRTHSMKTYRTPARGVLQKHLWALKSKSS